VFKGRAIWLDRQLFKLDVEGRRVSIAVHGGRWIMLRLFCGACQDKYGGAEPGEVRLVLKEDNNLYLHVASHQRVTFRK
jgi:hypothetical protein